MNLLSFTGAKRRSTAALATLVVAAGAGIAVSSGISGTTAALGTTAPPNLLPASSSFDSTTGGWTAKTGTTARRVSTPTQAGAGALEVVNSTTTAAEIGAVSATKSADCVTATPNNRYFARAFVRSGSTGRAAGISMSFLDGRGAVAARVVGQTRRDASSAWAQSFDVVGIAPPNAQCVIVGVAFGGVPAGEKHYIDSVVLTTKRSGVKNVVGPLHTTGNKILGPANNVVLLRGFNHAGHEGAAGAPIPTDDDVAHAKLWGANFMRIPLGSQKLLPSNCYYEPDYLQAVDKTVEMLTKRGMVALLNLHYQTVGDCGRFGQWPMAEYASAIAFWKQIAARYKNNPLVAFDLFNEPHHLSDDQWRNGGTITWQDKTYRTAGMQEMYNAVRSTGATNLVFVTGNGWGNLWPKKTTPVSGTNIVYAIHGYPCPQVPTPECTNQWPYDPYQFFQFWETAEQSHPIVVTEFGWPNPDDGLYIHNAIAYAEAHGWGWAVYTWGPVTWGRFCLLASAGPGKPYEPRPTGMPALAAFPGA